MAKTPVSLLQEFTMKHGYPLPKYEPVWESTSTSGTYTEFNIKVRVGNITAVGSAPLKQAAKHIAASRALSLLREFVSSEDKATQMQRSSTNVQVNFVGQLNELCVQLNLATPRYKELPVIGPPHRPEFTYECKVNSIICQATASKKQLAKHLSAKEMISKLNVGLDGKQISTTSDTQPRDEISIQKLHSESDIESNNNSYKKLDFSVQETIVKLEDPDALDNHEIVEPHTSDVQPSLSSYNECETKASIPNIQPEIDAVTGTEEVNFIGQLHELCRNLNLHAPSYTELLATGLQTERPFTCECKVESFTSKATADKKQQAKHLASKKMIEEIKRAYPLAVIFDDVIDAAVYAKYSGNVLDYIRSAFRELNKQGLRKPDAEMGGTSDVNKSAEKDVFPATLSKLIVEKQLTPEDFHDHFQKRDKENLDLIFKKLGITYKFDMYQESPYIAGLLLELATPYMILGVGSSKQSAEINLVHQIYHILDTCLSMAYNNEATAEAKTCDHET